MSWIPDSSGAFRVNGRTISCLMMDNGIPHNAMWVDSSPATNGEHYWQYEFKNLDGMATIGLTNDARFAAGYDLRCLCYNGNLSNGSELLVENFGPNITSNSIVGMLVIFDSNSGYLRVYFDINGTHLGRAYAIPIRELLNPHPVVSFSGIGTVTINQQNPAINTFAAGTMRDHPIPIGINGSWRLLEINGQPPQPSTSATLELTESAPYQSEEEAFVARSRKYMAVAKIINTIIFNLRNSSGSWSTSNVMTTLMAGTPEGLQLESELSDILLNPTGIDVIRGLLSYNGSNSETFWNRYDSSPLPYEGNPLNLNQDSI